MGWGGGNYGFLTDARCRPDEDLVVVVPQGATGPSGPGSLGVALAALVLGPDRPPEAPIR